MERGTFQVAVRLPKADYVKIQQLVEAGLYRSSADFLREAVRDKLGSMEVISIQDLNPQEAERIIEEYLTKHLGLCFASQIADELGLEYGTTFKIIHKLLEEGRQRSNLSEEKNPI
ncbi:MAG: ribbon-helix-helix domain-containing protein [Candidatus Bathyarchaeales archaeon]